MDFNKAKVVDGEAARKNAKKKEILLKLEEIKEIGITTILVEQNAIAALHLADRALILDMGEVVFDGSAREIIDNKELRMQYLAV